jgi:hypothetical protein
VRLAAIDLGEEAPDLLESDRLDDVAVEAGRLRADPLVLLAVSGERHDQGAGREHRANPSGDLDAVHVGKAEVEEDDFRMNLRAARDGRQTVGVASRPAMPVGVFRN